MQGIHAQTMRICKRDFLFVWSPFSLAVNLACLARPIPTERVYLSGAIDAPACFPGCIFRCMAHRYNPAKHASDRVRRHPCPLEPVCLWLFALESVIQYGYQHPEIQDRIQMPHL
ncbi:hypothetical protein BD289DRAFT_444764 [Coniella lustricola]|uniref:Uncharacterized protein n=1 Tax=Coniella lustricola TaxID=2025994 RepID=A0A2T2ZVL4_9PEZI|nr:hypothetical protein BD289DRAFT_444764 [Coniella lustricola]